MPTILFIPRTPLPRLARSGTGKVSVCSDCGTPFAESARSCSECGRVIERPLPVVSTVPAAPSTLLSPTAAGAWLVLAILLVIVVGGPIYWWRSQYAHVPKPETEWQQITRLQSEAPGEMLKECTNVVVGLTRIIRSSITTSEENPPYRWSGEIVAEFVNHVGGIDRTNIYFKFGTDTGPDGLMHLRCASEPEAEHRSRQRTDKR